MTKTLVEWEVLTYWCHCSTLWKRPSHGRRLRVRPVRSPGTEDIWCCAAVSSRGRMSLSSWLLGESLYNDISRISSVVLGGDRLHREPARSFPIDAPWISTTHAAPGGFHPTEAPPWPGLSGPQCCRTSLIRTCLWVPAVLTLTLFTALLNMNDDVLTLDWRKKSYTTFTPSNFVTIFGIYRKQDSFAFKIKKHVG